MLPYLDSSFRAKIVIRLFPVLFLIFCFLISASSMIHVLAAHGQAIFSVRPVTYDSASPATQSYFIFNTTPGVHLENQIRVSNTGTAEGTAILYGVDATTGQTGGAVYLSQTAPRTDVGAWLNIGKQSLTLKPGESQVVSFQLTLPHTLRPGQHLGGIVVENKNIQTSNLHQSIQVNMQNLAIVAVQVNLPGPSVYQITASKIEPGGANNYQSLILHLRNTGTMMLWPTGNLQVINPSSGQVLHTIQLKLDTFLPQTSIAYPVYIAGKALNVGNYQARLELHYTGRNTLLYKAPFAVTAANIAKVFSSAPTTAPAPLSSITSSSWLPVVGILCFVVLVSMLVFFWIFGRTQRKKRRDVEEEKQTHAITH